MRALFVSATVLVAALFLAIPARAQHLNESGFPCAQVNVPVELANCLSDARKKSDDKLKAVYEDLRNRLNHADVERLAIAQRLWIRYRRSNCTAERDLYEGGSASYPAYVACLEAMTRARTEELQVTYALKLK